jgi:Tfp pilus assembly protein PilV
MKLRSYTIAAFSLVEVTLALGIAAFCLLAVFGLMPVGVQTNRNATSQTAATNIMAAVVADLRATPSATTTSLQFGITFGTAKTLYFDGAGECSADLNGSTKVDGTSWSPPLQTRYRLNVTFPTSPTGLPYADLRVTWPAPVDPATTTPSGMAETFAAFDRN